MKEPGLLKIVAWHVKHSRVMHAAKLLWDVRPALPWVTRALLMIAAPFMAMPGVPDFGIDEAAILLALASLLVSRRWKLLRAVWHESARPSWCGKCRGWEETPEARDALGSLEHLVLRGAADARQLATYKDMAAGADAHVRHSLQYWVFCRAYPAGAGRRRRGTSRIWRRVWTWTARRWEGRT